MTKLKIVPIEEIPVAKDVPMDDAVSAFKLASQLEQLCLEKQGIGISATQAGIPWKLFLIFYPKNDTIKAGEFYPKNDTIKAGEFRTFVNCHYEPIGDTKIPKTLEGCLSLPKRFFRIEDYRWEKVLIKGYELVVINREPKFDKVEFEVSSKPLGSIVGGSIVFQHEIDHQLGQDGLISNIKTSRELDVHPIVR